MNKEATDLLFEKGRLLCRQAEFREALKCLHSASVEFAREGYWDQVVEAFLLMLRIRIEREEKGEAEALFKQIEHLVIAKNLTRTATLEYAFGFYHRVGTRDYEKANQYFQAAASKAMVEGNSQMLGRALVGKANALYKMGDLDGASKLIDMVLDGPWKEPETSISALQLRGLILGDRGDLNGALKAFWAGYDLLKDVPGRYFLTLLLLGIGTTYREMGEPNQAKIYLELAAKGLDPEETPRLFRLVFEEYEKVAESSDFDLELDLVSRDVHERKRGVIPLNNQLVLFELLRLFIDRKGEIISKEEIARRLWNEDYNPTVHDNKIYVALRRLRKLIEGPSRDERYIFLGKNGYYLEKNKRVGFRRGR